MEYTKITREFAWIPIRVRDQLQGRFCWIWLREYYVYRRGRSCMTAGKLQQKEEYTSITLYHPAIR